MAQTQDMCATGWHASAGEEVTFTNATALPGTLSQDGNNTFPFTAASGTAIPANGRLVTSIKSPIAHGTYYYDVSGCSLKTVTVP